jgi:predicted DNA-binding transcriptional regulator YafY
VVSGGSMVAFDRLRNSARTFTVHRISSAHPEPA